MIKEPRELSINAHLKNLFYIYHFLKNELHWENTFFFLKKCFSYLFRIHQNKQSNSRNEPNCHKTRRPANYHTNPDVFCFAHAQLFIFNFRFLFPLIFLSLFLSESKTRKAQIKKWRNRAQTTRSWGERARPRSRARSRRSWCRSAWPRAEGSGASPASWAVRWPSLGFSLSPVRSITISCSWATWLSSSVSFIPI